MGTALGWTATLTVTNGGAARSQWNARVSRSGDDLGGRTTQLSAGISLRPAPRWQFSLAPAYDRGTSARQYVATRDGGAEATFGRRYVFAPIERRTLSTQIRVNYSFTPDLMLEAYAEPFAASGHYRDAGELIAARGRALRTYGTDGTTLLREPDGTQGVTDGPASFTLPTQDFNVRSFRSNIVLRWEWRPGTTLYVVWQKDRFRDVGIGDRAGVGDLAQSFTAPGDDFFAMKVSFWLPVK